MFRIMDHGVRTWCFYDDNLSSGVGGRDAFVMEVNPRIVQISQMLLPKLILLNVGQDTKAADSYICKVQFVGMSRQVLSCIPHLLQTLKIQIEYLEK